MPEAPAWEVTKALQVEEVEEVERELFGRKLTGKRRRGYPEDEVRRWQEVFVERNAGTLSILRIDGPADMIGDAGVLLEDVLASIRPDIAREVLDPAQVGAEKLTALETHSAGAFKIAVPAEFTAVPDTPDGKWVWGDSLGLQRLILTDWGADASLTSGPARTLAQAKAAPPTKDALEEIFDEEPPVIPRSILALAGGRALPGIIAEMDSTPIVIVAFRHEGRDYTLQSVAWKEKSAISLVRNALSSLEFVSMKATE